MWRTAWCFGEQPQLIYILKNYLSLLLLLLLLLLASYWNEYFLNYGLHACQDGWMDGWMKGQGTYGLELGVLKDFSLGSFSQHIVSSSSSSSTRRYLVVVYIYTCVQCSIVVEVVVVCVSMSFTLCLYLSGSRTQNSSSKFSGLNTLSTARSIYYSRRTQGHRRQYRCRHQTCPHIHQIYLDSSRHLLVTFSHTKCQVRTSKSVRVEYPSIPSTYERPKLIG